MSRKVLHVSCQVKQADLWDLLRLMKASKCANVEVHPVDAPEGVNSHRKQHRRMKRTIRAAVADAMHMKEKKRTGEIAEELKAHPKSVYSAIASLIDGGKVKRVAPGLFMRIKENDGSE